MGMLIIIIIGCIIGGLIGLFSSDFSTTEDIIIGSIVGLISSVIVMGAGFIIISIIPSIEKTYELQPLSDEIYIKQISENEEYAFLIKDDVSVSITKDHSEIIIIETETIAPTVKIETYKLNKKYIFSIPSDSFQKFRENENRIS